MPVARSSRFRTRPRGSSSPPPGGLVLAAFVSVLVFAATQVLPGDAASAILGRSATPAAKAELRKQLGLDRPLVEQYWDWVSRRRPAATSARRWRLSRPVSDVHRATASGNTAGAGAGRVCRALPVSLLSASAPGSGATARPTTRSPARRSRSSRCRSSSSARCSCVHRRQPRAAAPGRRSSAGGTRWLDTRRLLVLPVLTLCSPASPYMVRMVRAGVSEAMRVGLRRDGAPERHARAPGRPALRAAQRARPDGAGDRAHAPVADRRHRHRRDASSPTRASARGWCRPSTARDIPLVQAVAMLLAAIYIVDQHRRRRDRRAADPEAADGAVTRRRARRARRGSPHAWRRYGRPDGARVRPAGRVPRPVLRAVLARAQPSASRRARRRARLARHRLPRARRAQPRALRRAQRRCSLAARWRRCSPTWSAATIGLIAGYTRSRSTTVLMRGDGRAARVPAAAVPARARDRRRRRASARSCSASASSTCPAIARIIRAATLEVSVRGYVEAAVARGERTRDPASRDPAEHLRHRRWPTAARASRSRSCSSPRSTSSASGSAAGGGLGA